MSINLAQYTAHHLLLFAAPSGAPTQISTEVLSSTAVIISWQQPQILDQNGIITGYEIEVHHLSSSMGVMYNVSWDTMSLHLEGIVSS